MLIFLLILNARMVHSKVLEKIGQKGLARMKAGQEDLTQNPEYLAAQANEANALLVTQHSEHSTLRVYDENAYTQSSAHLKKIEIFGTDYCKWCKEAKKLAQKRHLPYEFLDMSSQQNKDQAENYLKQLGVTHETIPQIFIIDNHNNRWFIGGFSDLDQFVHKHLHKS